MIYPILDMNNNVVVPTIVLCHRNKHKIGAIYPVAEWSITPDMNNNNECSFKVYKKVSGKENPYWDKIQDLKVIYIPEYDEYFQISLDKTETNETVKTITANNLGIAELSQTMLYDIEINTEDDIARDAYKIAYVYDSQDVSNCLLGRILSKAPHYKIKHVDESLCKLVRSFSVNDKSIYDFLSGDLADELNCLVVVGSDRTVSLYDLENSCPKCGYRTENETICSKCGTTMTLGYGEQSVIQISNDNLSDSITLTAKSDEVKNTFRVQGGDDIINAAIRAVNPNGTEYINRFSELQIEDMSDDLVNKINSYQTLYDSKKTEYKEIMNSLYDTIDQILYLTSGMMPSSETDDTDANKELAKLTADNLGMIAVQNLYVTGITTVNNAVKSVADIYVSTGYDVEIVSSTYENQAWKGRFKVTSVDNEDDTATNDSDIILLITDDYETFITQKIKKILDKQEMSDEEIYDWTKYGLNRLSSFSDAYQSCLDALIEAGVGDPSHEFYSSIYLVYYNKKLEVDAEIQVRETQIKEQKDRQAEYEKQRDDIQDELNFEEYLGSKLYTEYCLYRREDTYSNDNYISDGLSNSEILAKAEELLQVAQKEIYKASELQVDISTDVGNIWTIDEFQAVLPQWKCGNWMRIECDNNVYKVRLLDYTIKDSDFSKISCNFSSVLKVSNGVSDIQSVLNSAKSMATSYESVKRQAKQAEKTTDTVNSWVDEGANATALAIKSSDNQEVIYDNHGIRCREYDDVSETYADEQMQIVNNVLAITDDNWKTVRAAIGKIHYEDPEHPGDMLSAYGVLGETIVGKLLLGEALGIYNDGGSLKFTKDGLEISNDINKFIVNPNSDKLFKITKNGEEIIYVDTLGNGVLKGTIYATSGKIGGDNGWDIGDKAIYNGCNSLTSTDYGTYIGTDGIRNYKDENSNTTISGGKLVTNNAEIMGDLISYDKIKMFSKFQNNVFTFAETKSDENTLDQNEIILYEPSGNKILSSDKFNLQGVEGTIFYNSVRFKEGVGVSGSVEVLGNLSVSGTKSRVIDTKSYGDRLQYCVETPTPLFEDVGEGMLDENGICYIYIDEIFKETISNCDYQVFLQEYDDTKLYVKERDNDYFIIVGEKKYSKFAWRLIATQRNYETYRLEYIEEDYIKNDYTEDICDYLLKQLYNVQEEKYE